MNKVITFIINANFGILKKPDINDNYLTYNMMHKPALLGILGAIIGLSGYSETQKIPEYYKALKDIKISIKPQNDEKGNIKKTSICFNNSVGYANKDGGILQIYEQVLINPSYKCFLILDIEDNNQKNLYNNILNYEAVYIPYLGKNENYLWWNNAKEIEIENVNENEFIISSIFIKESILKNNLEFDLMNFDSEKFFYFERLPIGFDDEMFQYILKDFAYTNNILKMDNPLTDLYKTSENEIIQFF